MSDANAQTVRDLQERIANLEQEAKELRDAQRKTTFEEFLVACHGVHCDLKMAPPEFSSTGDNTAVTGCQYPALLQRWEQFDTLHQEIYDSVCRMLGSQQLFPERIGTDILRNVVAEQPAGTEKDIDRFNLIGVEYLAKKILKAMVQVEADTAAKFNFSEYRVSNTDRGVILTHGTMMRRYVIAFLVGAMALGWGVWHVGDGSDTKRWRKRCEEVKEAFVSSWNAYSEHAWGMFLFLLGIETMLTTPIC